MSQSKPTLPPPLAYETPSDAGGVRVEHGPDGSVTITIATRRTAARWVRALAWDELAVVVIAPLAWLGFKLFATNKPRAIVRLTSAGLHLLETSDDGLGIVETARSWPLSAIGELRKNRFEPGIWVTVAGKESFNLLEDVEEPMVLAVSDALMAARAQVSADVT